MIRIYALRIKPYINDPCYKKPKETKKMYEINLLTVFIAAMLTALATGLGALPFAIIPNKINKLWLGYANAMAAGLMLAASFALVIEGYNFGSLKTLLGMLIGVIFVVLGEKLLQGEETPDFNDIKKLGARQGFLIIAIMTIHSAAEGIGLGVAFGGGQDLGWFATIAIGIHNIPEGLAIALVCIPKGMRVRTAVLWSIFSSLPQPLLAVPSFMFVQVLQPLLPIGLGVAAGAMFWMVFAEILPESNENAPAKEGGVIVTVSIIIMLAMQALILSS